MALPKVVIVGAGIGGAKLLKLLAASGKFSITLVEPREYSEVLFAGVRAVVDPSVADKSLIPIASIPGKFEHVKEFAKTINSKSVMLASGQELPFDYLVVGTGSKFSGAGTYAPGANVLTIEARKAELKATADKIKAAKSIAVVGGGPVGLELIGEIVSKYAGKEITLVHAGPKLLDGKSPKMQKHIDYLLAKYKVTVLLNDHADKDEPPTLTTKSGKSVPADVVVWAAGATPNSAVFAGGDLTSLVNDKGYVKVDEFLRLEQHPNIFVLGDVNSTPGPKLGAQAGFQADSVAANLVKAAVGKPPAKFAPPMPPTGGMFVTFGPGDGTGHVQGCACTGSFPISWIKGKDLFVGMARGNLGVK